MLKTTNLHESSTTFSLPHIKKLTLGCLALAFLLLLSPTISQAQNYREANRSNEIIVSLSPGSSISDFNQRYGTSVKERLNGTDQYLLALPDGTRVRDKLAELASDTSVTFAGPNFRIKAAEISQGSQPFVDQGSQPFVDQGSQPFVDQGSQPFVDQGSQPFVDQGSQPFVDGLTPTWFYNLKSFARVKLSEVHNHTRGWGVKVAVIDTGIDAQHPWLVNRLAYPQYDFVDNDTNPADVSGGAGYGHGTFVAGLIGLTAPGAKIMPLRAFGSDGYGTTFAIAKAIRFAVDNGADVINMSFGMLERDPLIEDALEYAGNRAFLVSAGGNDNLNELHYPSSRKNRTLSVVSTDWNDKKASFTNYHQDAQVSAPGWYLFSSYPGGRWGWWSGTSFSTALASGEAALILQLDLNLNRAQLKRIIIDSGVNIDALNPQHAGQLGVRLDFLGAVNRFNSGN